MNDRKEGPLTHFKDGEVQVDVEMPSSKLLENDNEERGIVQRSASKKKKFFPYFLKVDPDQDDRASEIKLCSIKRPHMRAFHFAWWCYHVAFLMW